MTEIHAWSEEYKFSVDFRIFFAHNNSNPMALTPRQKEVVDFLVQFVDDNGYSPSYEEIAAGLKLASLATVHKHISALEARGYLKRGFNQSRSLDVSPEYIEQSKHHKADKAKVLAMPAPPAEVPLVGRIAAGPLAEEAEQVGTLSFADFMGNETTYALEVRGNSMIDDHILNGDYVLVERAFDANNGQIVVALVEGTETTLKRFYREPNNMARLQPANAEMEPIMVPLEHVRIHGRVLAVMRKYR